ncbi:hypothetical protein [Rubripirellula reticaptiva]|uniref:Secreted protein n=1 Tax=Rubripirellula reticaptiva TaxID=2528013 RepID=A0A5C6F5S3_9BACT|nr:hypothetical protein [Rubripirellula reticaptiva]TWU55900.1 hypothetical protein Poly59_22030 [Rubripirellula reticaptiva]
MKTSTPKLIFAALMLAMSAITGCGGGNEATLVEGDNTQIEQQRIERQQSYAEAMKSADKAGPGN